MSMRCILRIVLLGLILALLAPLALAAGKNMIGRQSQNEGMLVLPAAKKITVDGDLREWDWSGRIWVFADSAVRNRYSVEAAAQWDKDYLYLAAKWKDPTPMFSLIDPEFNVNEGWKCDAWQIRFRTDKISHATMWYYTTKKMPVFHMAYGKSATEPFGGPGTFWEGAENGTNLGRGIEMAYKATEDGTGFLQEVKIPWSIISDRKDWKAGDTFQMGYEFLWGDPTGNTWPVHRYADNLQPGMTSREFFWTNYKGWGGATLAEKGPVPVREYVDESSKLEGTIPVRADIPADAARFTIVIENDKGQRIRNLAGDCDPMDYTVKTKGALRTVEVKWDGLDDRGKLAQPGTYRVRGLTHKGLGAEYEMCFYNPGTPPWPTQDGRGTWGADHSTPSGVAAGGDWTFVTWGFAEGGSGLIGIDPTGQKRWGDRRGTNLVTADAQYVYSYVTGWYVNETLCRYRAKDGVFAPFELDGKPRTFDLPLTEILGENPGKITGLAVSGNKLLLALNTGKLAVLDAASAKPLAQFDIPNLGRIAAGKDGQCYGLIAGTLQAVDIATGATTAIPTPTLGKPVALAVDNDGNIVIADGGPDCQVKAYSPAGKPVYTCGKKGGRALRGKFDEQAMINMSSVAVDSTGRVWVTENWNTPRRVSVWGKDGKLVKDYIGNTGYAGTGSYLHDQDPTLAYTGPIEMKLDKANATWKVTQIIWVPDKSKGESFTIETGAHVHPQRFTSSASGQPREYLYTHDDGNVLFMERNGKWQPVSAICKAADISGELAYGGAVVTQPSGELAGLNAYDVVFWNDNNRDAKVQRNECTVILTSQPGDEKRSGRSAVALGNGWGGRIGDDLCIYTDGLVRYKPVSFTDDGAPIYGLDGRYPLGPRDNGDLVPVPGEDRLLCLSFAGYAGPTKLNAVNLATNKVEWIYQNPYPGVHGSHNATMPKPGLLIGPLKIMGVAKANDDAGNVFAMRGNLGQDFFLTTDGLYVGALFQDCRLPGESLPDKEAMLKGMPLEGFSEGGEPFSGWFGRQADGKVRMTNGWPRQAAMIVQINGLETIKRFVGGTVTVDVKAIAAADADNQARARVAVAPKTYTVKRLAKTPTIDGIANEWRDVPSMAIAREGQPDKATVRLAYDDANLYASYEVQDSSPWRNNGKDLVRLFKTGDALDLQLNVLPATKRHRDPQAGDTRLLIAQFEGKPVAVLMVPTDPTSKQTKVRFNSPVGTRSFDRVEIIADARISVKAAGNGYVVEAAIPLAALKLTPQAGLSFIGDVGFISSDAQGLNNMARTYWANPHTNLVNDDPSEAWLYPDTWGELKFE